MKPTIQKVVIVSIPRTGSTLICELLAQHPEIFGLGEVFIHNNDGRKYYHQKATGETRYFPGEAKLDLYLDYLEAIARLDGKPKLSFKLMDYQSPALWELIERDTSILVIHSRRYSSLASLASNKAAEITGHWHGHSDDSLIKSRDVRVKIDPDELIAWDERNRAMSRRFLALRNPKIEVDYLDLDNSPQRIAARMYNFIRVDPNFLPEVTQRKLNPRPLSERVTNYQELERTLSGVIQHSFA